MEKFAHIEEKRRSQSKQGHFSHLCDVITGREEPVLWLVTLSSVSEKLIFPAKIGINAVGD